MRKWLVTLIYLVGFSVLTGITIQFHGYYRLPLLERPHSDLHLVAKPGGKVGHGLGVVGSSMILLLFLYSLRKRRIIRWGNLTTWLDVHIIFGILGPLFVTLHTAMKFGGIVVVSYISMIAVMISGLFGRYIYLKIPRAITGGELSGGEIEEREREIVSTLKARFRVGEEEVGEFVGTMNLGERVDESAVRMILTLLADDIARPLRDRSLRHLIREQRPDLDLSDIEGVVRQVRKLARLRRNLHFLEMTHRIFHYWHVIHRPFAYVMILIMFIHVSVVVYYGYRWVF